MKILADHLAVALIPHIQEAMKAQQEKEDLLKELPALVTKEEVSIFFRVDMRTVYDWTKRGILPPPERAGKRSVYKKTDLQKLIDSGRLPA